MKNYTRETSLDEFWMDVLKNKQAENLKKVIQLLLPISHGNAQLERRFSINGDMIVEHLKEDSNIAQRIVYDYVLGVGGLDKLTISKDLILFMRNANQRWNQALED